MLYTFEIIENEAHFHWHKHKYPSTHTQHTTFILCTHANDLSPHCHTLSFILMLSVCLFALLAIVQSLKFWSISGFLVLITVYISLTSSLLSIHLKYFDAFVYNVRLGRQEKSTIIRPRLSRSMLLIFTTTNKMMRTSYNFVQLFPHISLADSIFFSSSVSLRNQSERYKTSKKQIANNVFAKQIVWLSVVSCGRSRLQLLLLMVLVLAFPISIYHFHWHRRKPIICFTFKVNIRLSNSRRKLMFFSCVFHRSFAPSISSCLKFMACFFAAACFAVCAARTLFLDPRQLMHWFCF